MVELWDEFMTFHAEIDGIFSTTPEASRVFSEHLLTKIPDENSVAVLAECDARIVGYCIASIREKPPVFVHRRHGLISDLAVEGSFRRQGVGQALFSHVREWFQNRSIDRLELRTVSANATSNAFWNEMGFRTFAEEKFCDFSKT